MRVRTSSLSAMEGDSSPCSASADAVPPALRACASAPDGGLELEAGLSETLGGIEGAASRAAVTDQPVPSSALGPDSALEGEAEPLSFRPSGRAEITSPTEAS